MHRVHAEVRWHERMRLGLEEVRGGDAQRPLWLLEGVLIERRDRTGPGGIV